MNPSTCSIGMKAIFCASDLSPQHGGFARLAPKRAYLSGVPVSTCCPDGMSGSSVRSHCLYWVSKKLAQFKHLPNGPVWVINIRDQRAEDDCDDSERR